MLGSAWTLSCLMTRSCSTTQAVSDGSSTSFGVWRLAVTSRRISDNILALGHGLWLCHHRRSLCHVRFHLVSVNLKTSAWHLDLQELPLGKIHETASGPGICVWRQDTPRTLRRMLQHHTLHLQWRRTQHSHSTLHQHQPENHPPSCHRRPYTQGRTHTQRRPHRQRHSGHHHHHHHHHHHYRIGLQQCRLHGGKVCQSQVIDGHGKLQNDDLDQESSTQLLESWVFPFSVPGWWSSVSVPSWHWTLSNSHPWTSSGIWIPCSWTFRSFSSCSVTYDSSVSPGFPEKSMHQNPVEVEPCCHTWKHCQAVSSNHPKFLLCRSCPNQNLLQVPCCALQQSNDVQDALFSAFLQLHFEMVDSYSFSPFLIRTRLTIKNRDVWVLQTGPIIGCRLRGLSLGRSSFRCGLWWHLWCQWSSDLQSQWSSRKARAGSWGVNEDGVKVKGDVVNEEPNGPGSATNVDW